MNRFVLILALLAYSATFTAAEGGRHFDVIFPSLDLELKKEALSGNAYYRLLKKDETLLRMRGVDEFEKTREAMLKKNPAALLEMINIIPRLKKNSISLVEIYNDTLRVSALAGRTYFSHTRKREVPLFKKAWRIQGENEKDFVPVKESADVIVEDVNLGECHYRTELSKTDFGIIFSISNSKAMSAFFVTVFKKENFTMIFYLEPINEGVLVYSVMGMTAESFAASNVDISSAAKKRFEVVSEWLIEGIGGMNG